MKQNRSGEIPGKFMVVQSRGWGKYFRQSSSTAVAASARKRALWFRGELQYARHRIALCQIAEQTLTSLLALTFDSLAIFDGSYEGLPFSSQQRKYSNNKTLRKRKFNLGQQGRCEHPSDSHPTGGQRHGICDAGSR